MQGTPRVAPFFNYFSHTLRTMIGVMEDKGLFFGLMKLAGAGGRRSGAISVGVEKSSISLFSTMPVEGDNTLAPKL